MLIKNTKKFCFKVLLVKEPSPDLKAATVPKSGTFRVIISVMAYLYISGLFEGITISQLFRDIFQV